jgi:23S rRNA G2069 N7-methylase RlmK/C1962 C5-methylase RlmI
MVFVIEPFVNRLQKNYAKLAKWAQKNEIGAWRLYDRDMPEYPFAVDIYGDAAVFHYFDRRPQPKLFSPEADALRAREEYVPGLKAVAEFLKIPERNVFLKRRKIREDGEQYEKVGTVSQTRVISEHGLKFLVNLSDYLDTGLFLDHRKTRVLVRSLSEGKRVLNLFAYTGAISVHAAAGGASEVTTLDLSNTYLDWAKENFRLNGFVGDNYKFIREDTLRFLSDTRYGVLKYDLIVVDPPSFSNSKKMEGYFDVQEHHVDLLRSAAALLSPGGTILFSNNLRGFVFDAELAKEWSVQNITSRTIPEDFRNERIHHAFLVKPS